MIRKQKAVFNWSGGKDSALALHKTLQEDKFEVISLLTTFNAKTSTSSIHAIPLDLLQRQAECIGIPLFPVTLSKNSKNYEEGMAEAVNYFKEKGVSNFIFGDIHLKDIKKYREEKLNPLGINVIEPLWGKSSLVVMNEFLKSGIRTKVIVAQADKLDENYVGKDITEAYINSLPKDIDVCGENGEFHTFAYDGPLFKKEVEFKVKETKLMEYSFKMEDGEVKKFKYWQVFLTT